MLNRLWLLFAQTVTILFATWFIITTLKPAWISGEGVSSIVDSVNLKEGAYDGSALSPGSYHDAVKRSMPAVVNIFTSKTSAKQKMRKGN